MKPALVISLFLAAGMFAQTGLHYISGSIFLSSAYVILCVQWVPPQQVDPEQSPLKHDALNRPHFSKD